MKEKNKEIDPEVNNFMRKKMVKTDVSLNSRSI